MPELGPPTPLICAGCGLLCDDVTADRSGDAVRLAPDCHLGAAWLSQCLAAVSAPRATIGGRAADVETALRRAAGLLREARRPLFHGFGGATVEDARAALALADSLGALVAPEAAAGDWAGAPAIPLRGASTATLGEIRDRSELVVIWREDPEATHPRLLDRLGLGGAGRSPGGVKRTLILVDDRDSGTAGRADVQLRWGRERDLEALSALHVLQRKLTVRPGELQDELTGLLERIGDVAHAAFVYGPGLAAGAGGQRRVLALHELVRELCLDRHVVTLELPAATGTRSARDVLGWQTGYSETIDLASGHPELVNATLPLDSAEGVDVALCIEGSTGMLGDGVREIALGSRPVPGAEVSIRTAAAGVHAAGTAHRLDGVPLTLQAPLPDDAPTPANVLARLLEEVNG